MGFYENDLKPPNDDDLNEITPLVPYNVYIRAVLYLIDHLTEEVKQEYKSVHKIKTGDNLDTKLFHCVTRICVTCSEEHIVDSTQQSVYIIKGN